MRLLIITLSIWVCTQVHAQTVEYLYPVGGKATSSAQMSIKTIAHDGKRYWVVYKGLNYIGVGKSLKKLKLVRSEFWDFKQLVPEKLKQEIAAKLGCNINWERSVQYNNNASELICYKGKVWMSISFLHYCDTQPKPNIDVKNILYEIKPNLTVGEVMSPNINIPNNKNVSIRKYIGVSSLDSLVVDVDFKNNIDTSNHLYRFMPMQKEFITNYLGNPFNTKYELVSKAKFNTSPILTYITNEEYQKVPLYSTGFSIIDLYKLQTIYYAPDEYIIFSPVFVNKGERSVVLFKTTGNESFKDKAYIQSLKPNAEIQKIEQLYVNPLFDLGGKINTDNAYYGVKEKDKVLYYVKVKGDN